MALQQRKYLNIIFTLLTILGLGVTVLVIWYFIQQNKFSLYRDEGGAGFTIKYPSDWTVAPYKEGTNVIFYSPLENALDVFKENVNIVVQDMSAQKMIPDLNKYTTIAINQMQVVFKQNFKLLESKPITISGVPGHEIVFIGHGPEMDLKIKCAWTIKRKASYQFTYGAVASQYDKYIDKVDAMLRSLHIP